MYNQFSFGPSNKFTSIIDISGIFADEETREMLADNLIATLTCVQTEMPAPPQFIKQRLDDVEKMTGQKLTPQEVLPREALEGQMMQMFEIHMRPELLAEDFMNEEMMKNLRTQIESELDLQKSKI